MYETACEVSLRKLEMQPSDGRECEELFIRVSVTSTRFNLSRPLNLLLVGCSTVAAAFQRPSLFFFRCKKIIGVDQKLLFSATK